LTARAPPERSTLSLHDALPICAPPLAGHSRPGVGLRTVTAAGGPPHAISLTDAARRRLRRGWPAAACRPAARGAAPPGRSPRPRSEEHTSELQSRENLVCRLLL